ncbi:MAG: hypothetical protein IT353_24875, partial [Gemmatimonadaceae bacterium]|nr:hypothetical protein [Gemmatimonadaceae bacterium]
MRLCCSFPARVSAARLVVLAAFATTIATVPGVVGTGRAEAQAAATAAPRYDPATYVQSSYDIPMRDGVTLHLEIFSPPNATEALPFLMQRTPYGVGAARGRLSGSHRELAYDGYHFVFQDIRGRYKSNGTFVM